MVLPDSSRVSPGALARSVCIDVELGEGASPTTDIGSTGYEVGVLNRRIRPGDTVAVVGAGPIGLSSILDRTVFSPSHIVAVDPVDARLDDTFSRANDTGALKVVVSSA